MKKFLKFFYCSLMALLVLSLSGCGHHSSNNNSAGQSTPSHLMILSSPVFEKGESYKIYKGDKVSVTGTTAKYYLAPGFNASEDESIVMNLEFVNDVSEDTPFVITKENDEATVIFSYNPSGSPDIDISSETVIRTGGGTQQQKYTSLTLATESDSTIQVGEIEVVDDEVITITLSSSDNSATLSGAVTGSVPEYDFIWEVSQDHANEYWVEDGEIIEDESKLNIDTSNSNGIYIARDIRYVPNTLSFSESQTATKANGTAEGDSDQLYVAYYSTKASGVKSADTYIIAALPTTMGMAQPGGEFPGDNPPSGDNPGGEPPSGEFPGGETPPTPPTQQNFGASAAETGFDAIVAAMTHSASEAYANPVLHITKPGTYSLKGTWNGQIWVDIPDKSVNSSLKTKKDPAAQVVLVLDGVNVICTVAPALVFKKVYECDQEENYASFDVGSVLFNDTDGAVAGAVVVIGSGTTNTFTGTNVARLNNIEVNDDTAYNSESLIGKYVKAQDKMYKLDGAFHSRMSMLIGLEYGASSGTLNINSDYEGLDSEMHMLIDSGTINVTADDDGINVNEDGVSVFTMDDGVLTVNSSGGDGIDSNGWVVINGGTLNITAGQSAQGSAGESGIDCDNVYISDNATYNWSAASGGTQPGGGEGGEGEEGGGGSSSDEGGEGEEGSTSDEYTDESGNNILTIIYRTKAVALASGDLSDAERREAGVPNESDVFQLVNKVNNFSGIVTK